MRVFSSALFLLMKFSFALAGQDVGSGGDAVVCKKVGYNNFSGYYSLDFLAQYDVGQLPVAVNDLNESLERIEKMLQAKLPELASNFHEFRRDIFNVSNFDRPHIWTQAPFGLIDLNDEKLVTLIPENCRDGDRIEIVQAVIRQKPEQVGLPEDKISYKFVKEVTDKLDQNNSVQLSFLLVHEWLWTFSSSVERNRRINYWLHSAPLEVWTREQWITNLHGIGFVIPKIQAPIWEPAICEKDSSVDTFLRGKRRTDGLVLREEYVKGIGEVYARTITCDKSKGCVEKSYIDGTMELRSRLKGPIELSGYVQGGWAGYLVTAMGYATFRDQYITSCWIGKGCGDLAEAPWITPVNDWEPRFNFTDVMGKDCYIVRGRRVINNGNFNDIEEVAFYFPKLELRE